MTQDVTPEQARAALDSVARQRLRVVEEIDVPARYWLSVAIGWVCLGVVADVANAWVVTAATLAFGALHSAFAPRYIDGRHRSGQLRVSAELAGRHTAALVLGGLVVLTALTVALALAAHADGAQHPTTIASMIVAVIVVLGGPRLLDVVRRRAARRVQR